MSAGSDTGDSFIAAGDQPPVGPPDLVDAAVPSGLQESLPYSACIISTCSGRDVPDEHLEQVGLGILQKSLRGGCALDETSLVVRCESSSLW